MMRSMSVMAASFCLAAGACFAQSPPAVRPMPVVKHHPPEHVERPVDVGPYTPEANKAYQGGGVILQGAPGAPAPTPEATPPGQTPRNAVPQDR